jgi:hypothetical protein
MRKVVLTPDPDKSNSEKLIRVNATDLEPTHEGEFVAYDETGLPILALAQYTGDLAKYRKAIMEYPISTTVRAAGIRNASSVFGFVSRSPVMRRAACSSCAGQRDHPEAHNGIIEAAEVIADMMSRLVPDVHAKQLETLTAVREEWKLPGGLWTSGVLNKTSNLPYHYDRNNFDAWSAMPVVRRHARGGHLHIPRLNVVLKMNDGDVLFFNGQAWVHGVTPITLLKKDAYRYSAVYYPVKKMEQCLSWEAEMEHARQWRTDNESNLLARQRDAGLLTDE